MSKTKWLLDPAHSEIVFKIRHMMISNVSGQLKDYQVEVETIGDDFSKASITLTGKMASLTTNEEQRDTHLHSADFFDVITFPDLKFQSTRIETIDADTFTLCGDLTMRGIAKEVSLNVEFGGKANDRSGNETAGFTVTGKIKRGDWGINFNRILDNGSVGLSEEVRIPAEIRMVKQAATKVS